MELYWQKTRRGMDLVVKTDSGEVVKVGGVRETRRGIEAMAFTTGYDPGRSGKDLPNVDEAMRFVEMFEPWREFFPEPLTLSPGVRPMVEEGES
jgi:hypothetical protein